MFGLRPLGTQAKGSLFIRHGGIYMSIPVHALHGRDKAFDHAFQSKIVIIEVASAPDIAEAAAKIGSPPYSSIALGMSLLAVLSVRVVSRFRASIESMF